MKIYICISLFFLSFYSCQNGKEDLNQKKSFEINIADLEIDSSRINTNEIDQLKNLKDHKIYLEKINKEDQNVRQGQDADIILNYGKDSKEYKQFSLEQYKVDALNLAKIEYYLEKWGHPKKSELGATAASTPWLVIHHSADYESRARNFKWMQKAHNNQDIDDGAYTFYLGRMYQIKFGNRLKLENPYRVEDEIKAYVEALDLQ